MRRLRELAHTAVAVWKGAGHAAQLQLPWLKWPQAQNCTVSVCKSWEHADNVPPIMTLGQGNFLR